MTITAVRATAPSILQGSTPESGGAFDSAVSASTSLSVATSSATSGISLLGLFRDLGDAFSDAFDGAFDTLFGDPPPRATTQSVTQTPPPVVTVTEPAPFEPKGFLYNGHYFKKYHSAGGIDVKDKAAVEDRVIESTFAYLLKEEPNVDDFGVIDVQIRPIDPVADKDLLRVNPRALYVVDVIGVQGDGTRRVIPSVMNSDGAVFVDPRIRTS